LEKFAGMRISITPNIMTKISGAISLVVAGVLFLLVFIIDAVQKNLEIDLGFIVQLRNLFVVIMFVGIYLFIKSVIPKRSVNALRMFGIVFITILAFLTIFLILRLISIDGYEAFELKIIPTDYLTILFFSFAAVVSGATAIIFLYTISQLIFFKRRKGTQRNFIIFLVMLGAASLSTWNLQPLEKSTLSYILFMAAVVAGIANSFRFSWIVYLSKREKMFSIGYGLLLFILLIFFNVSLSENGFINKSLLFYSYPLQFFVRIVAIFSVIYFGMSFVVSLFHLPTAEAFDRKRIELSSVQNLSRLINRVFDFKDLVQTVTNLTIEVCEARSAWLEIIRYEDTDDGEYRCDLVSHKYIDPGEIDLITGDETGLRRYTIETKKVVVIDEFARDRRTRNIAQSVRNIGSLICVPLVSQDQMIGILYAAKTMEYSFDQEDTALISTFADHASIAIENSRLIEQSIERERMQQELMVAQKVQKKLLNQNLPKLAGFELDAFSAPAFEVGGDYYDASKLDEKKIGIVVGDVSGKGVSAAFYMAELKGIFQALSKSSTSTKDFLIKANNALFGSIEKSAFISLIYAILDSENASMCLSRAGHCPMIHFQNGKVNVHKPTGIGLGLTGASLFNEVIEEESIAINQGDICVFYTDGVTEARNREGEEFGTERLIKMIVENSHLSPQDLRKAILQEITSYTGLDSFDDDLTILILKRNIA
jgi:phosphoserine phosphatase RsbU/P